MRIVFCILRMNWYRVLATTIDAALAAGHDVECWHSVGGNHWASNRPCRERVPVFIHGQPAVYDYDSDSGFLALLQAREPEAVISLCCPWSDAVCNSFQQENAPAWVTIATNDSFIGAAAPGRLTANRLIVLRTSHEQECIVHDHTVDLKQYLARIEENPETHGEMHIKLLRGNHENPWSSNLVEEFNKRVVRTGYPLLDSVRTVDCADVRQRWGIPSQGLVVGCLASPYGQVLNVAWEKAFAASTWWARMRWSFASHGFRGIVSPAPSEKEVMCALKRFCNRHRASLVVKMRHTQDAPAWMRKLADHIVGEESYYPHSAVELAAVADVMFGFFSTGAPEAIACGHPFVNLEIPGYNREDWEQSASMFVGMFDHPGSAYSISAARWIRESGDLPFDTFGGNASGLRTYADCFCGPLDGHHSARVVRSVEHVVAGLPPSDIPCDSKGFVALQ